MFCEFFPNILLVYSDRFLDIIFIYFFFFLFSMIIVSSSCGVVSIISLISHEFYLISGCERTRERRSVVSRSSWLGRVLKWNLVAGIMIAESCAHTHTHSHETPPELLILLTAQHSCSIAHTRTHTCTHTRTPKKTSLRSRAGPFQHAAPISNHLIALTWREPEGQTETWTCAHKHEHTENNYEIHYCDYLCFLFLFYAS